MKARHDRLAAGEPFDWGAGEMLAYSAIGQFDVAAQKGQADSRFFG